MGTGYAKTDPTNFVDGETIEAADFTTEYNAIDAAFHLSTGHTHDGTTAEGGPVTKLLGTAITIGDATSGTDIAVTFDGESNDGVLTWMEDEDYFKFSDDALMNSTEKLYFRDTAIYINSSADGQLDLVADTEIQIAATTVDLNGNLDVSGTYTGGGLMTTGGNIVIPDAGNIGSASDTDAISISSGGVVTMNQIPVFSAGINVSGGTIAGTLATAAQSSITSLGTLTTLTVDNVIINGTTIGHTGDTDLMTLTSGVLTVAGELDATTLDISGNADIDGTTNLDAVDIDGAVQIDATVTVGVDDQGYDVKFFGDTASAYVMWDTSADKLLTAGGATVDIVKDKLLIGGTAVTTTAAELNVLDAVTAGTVTASLGVVVDSNKDIGSFRNITLTGELDAGSLDISGDADIDGTLEADAITVDGTTLAEYISDTAGAMVGSNTETGVTVTYQDSDNTIDFAIDAAQTTITSIYATDLIMGEDSQTAIDFGTANEIDFKVDNAARLTLTSGALYPVTDNQIDLGTSSLEFKDAFFDGTVTADAFAGPLTGNVTGTADVATVATTVTITDNESTDEDNAIIFTAGGDVDGGNIGLESDGTLTYNPSTGKITATGFIGALTGDVTGTSSKATVSDSTANTNFPVVFHDESDALLDDTGALRYNPSSGTLLVPNLSVAGTTTTVDTVTMEAANAVIFEGATADAHETTLSIVDPTGDHTQYLINQGGYIPLLAAATTTAITSTPAELNILDGVTSTAAELNILDGVTSTAAEINLIDGGTARGTTAVASGDGILINDGGTMRMTNVDTVSTYFASHTVGGGNIVTTGALNSGSITSGFGAIDNGSSNITTTGDISGGTVNATSDTAAGDNAAIGYTSGEGLILTGQGSTSDITLKNDADATVFTVPTGTDDILFPDGAKAMWGAASDLTIHHDGSNSYISDTGTGGLYILANVFAVNNAANNEAQLIGTQDGAVELYHNGLKKFNTATTGIEVGASGVNATIKTHSAGTSNLTLGVNAGNTIESGGNYNVAVGDEAGTAITTGDGNVVVGYAAGDAITTGNNNTALGAYALTTENAGSSITAIGYSAGNVHDGGAACVYVGAYCGDANTTGGYNTFLGDAAGGANTTGGNNTFVGQAAGDANTTASNNVAVGQHALGANTTGTNNVAIGKGAVATCTDSGNHLVGIGYQALAAAADSQFCVAIGKDAGLSITSGDSNVLIGYHAGDAITTGSGNTAVGDQALGSNTTASGNTAVGNSAGLSNTTGGENVFIGAYSGDANTTGGNNAALGYNSLGTNTTGAGNTAIGRLALFANTTAADNTAVGNSCLQYNTTGTSNVAVGTGALYVNTTGSYNTAVGHLAGDAVTTGTTITLMGYAAGSANTTGDSATAFGHRALNANTTGNANTAVGYDAGLLVTTGTHNVMVGVQAGDAQTTALGNTLVGAEAGGTNTTGTCDFFGYQAGDAHTTGTENCGFGRDSLGKVTTSTCNNGFGWHTMAELTTGSYNTAFGCSAGNTITTGNHNMVLGHNCDVSGATVIHEITLGTNSQVGKGSSTAFITANGGAVYAGNNSADFSTTSDRRIKKNIVDNNIGLEKINQIQVRNFEYRTPDEIEELPKHAAIDSEGTQLGVIAQEVQGFLPQIINEESTGCLSVDGSDIKWLLVNAVKELSTQVDELRAEIKTLKGE